MTRRCAAWMLHKLSDVFAWLSDVCDSAACRCERLAERSEGGDGEEPEPLYIKGDRWDNDDD